jgi:FMN phosphatase YigB (HAD superfamily)
MTQKKCISFVIVDLDNTIYDWFYFWHSSFTAMVDRVMADSGIPREKLFREIKEIHTKHGTAEYSLLIQEIPSLKEKHPDQDLRVVYRDAIEEYRRTREKTLKPYPRVRETLQTLKEYGCVIAAYTESMAFYTNDRIRRLELDGLIDYLYSPPDHEFPENLTPEELRSFPTEHYKLKRTLERAVPKGEKKPNPTILLNILKEINAMPDNTLYLGDSLTRDVLMAQQAGVSDVWAKYGVATQKQEYNLLRQVTFWTDEEVEREKKLKEIDVKPNYILEQSITELFTLFNFGPWRPPAILSADVRISNIVEVWKKTIDVQQHFNDLELRIRNYALTVLVGVLSVAALTLKEHMEVTLWGHKMTVAVLLLSAGLVGWIAFYFMDRWWYHRLLYGAVNHGRHIEAVYQSIIPEISLTQSIGAASPIVIRGRKIRTPIKIDIFYAAISIVILVTMTLLLLSYTPQPEQKSQQQTDQQQSAPPMPQTTLEPTPQPSIAPTQTSAKPVSRGQ